MRENPNVSTQTFVMDLDLQGPIYPKHFGFDIAFGFSDIPLDPSIGSFQFIQTTFSYQTYSNGSTYRVK